MYISRKLDVDVQKNDIKSSLAAIKQEKIMIACLIRCRPVLLLALWGVLSKVSEYVYVVISQGTEAPLRWLTLWWRRVRVK